MQQNSPLTCLLDESSSPSELLSDFVLNEEINSIFTHSASVGLLYGFSRFAFGVGTLRRRLITFLLTGVESAGGGRRSASAGSTKPTGQSNDTMRVYSFT